MKKLLKDPLLHFLLIGAALFIVFGLIKNPAGDQENNVVITWGDIEFIKANFSRTWKRPPTENELANLIEDKVRDEISYREAVAMGLDQEDPVIRKRMRMKVELLAEDIAGLAPASDEDLTIFLEKNRDSFRREPQISFKHVYLSSNKRGAEVENDARDLLAKLRSVGPGAAPEAYGDPIMLPKEFTLDYARNVERLFGKSFSRDLLQVEPGGWAGPVRSSYGHHLVFVRDRVAARHPELSEIREEVERDWSAKRRRDVKEKMHQKLREQYTVTIEDQTPPERQE
jgi:parvulin-like peptidyl-prolyl isomerase